jgi:hypothetical protein
MKKYLTLFIYVFYSLTATAAQPAGAWLVVGKSCNGKSATVSQEEQVQLANGMYAFISRVSDSNSQYCVQIQASTRLTQSFNQSDSGIEEAAVLTPFAVRTICKLKQDRSVISDQTTNIQGNEHLATIALKNDGTGVIEEEPSSICPSGKLRLELKKK